MVTDINPGPAGLRPGGIAPVTGKTAMFSGDDGVHGREPWVTNGTTAGTALYEDLHPGPAGSDPEDITPQAFFAGIEAQFPIWYFSANDGTHGREFFVAYDSDPPAEVYKIRPVPPSADPGPFDSVAGETGLLALTTATHGRELFDVQPAAAAHHRRAEAGHPTKVAGVGPGSNPVLGPTNQIGLTPEPEPVTRTYFARTSPGTAASSGRRTRPSASARARSARSDSALTGSGSSMGSALPTLVTLRWWEGLRFSRPRPAAPKCSALRTAVTAVSCGIPTAGQATPTWLGPSARVR